MQLSQLCTRRFILFVTPYKSSSSRHLAAQVDKQPEKLSASVLDSIPAPNDTLIAGFRIHIYPTRPPTLLHLSYPRKHYLEAVKASQKFPRFCIAPCRYQHFKNFLKLPLARTIWTLSNTWLCFISKDKVRSRELGNVMLPRLSPD